MDQEQFKEIIKILKDKKRNDLATALQLLVEDITDDDYKPPVRKKEPDEEYDLDTGEEEELEVGVSPDGFFHLK